MTETSEPKTVFTPFDFIASVSQTKEELILNANEPELIEKQYNAFMTNRGLSYFPDTILHANEMNIQWHLPNDAQYRYYLSAIKSKKRYSKWFKSEENKDLDTIQTYYQCNRTVAKGYLKLLSPENIKSINNKMNEGG